MGWESKEGVEARLHEEGRSQLRNLASSRRRRAGVEGREVLV